MIRHRAGAGIGRPGHANVVFAMKFSSAGRSRSLLQGVGSLVQKVVATLNYPCNKKLPVCEP